MRMPGLDGLKGARVVSPASLCETFQSGVGVLTVGDRRGDIVIASHLEVTSELEGSGDPPF